jgi:signal transduction histidine kinase
LGAHQEFRLIIAPLPDNEEKRLATLRRYGILDTEMEKSYQELVELASQICGTPIALISLVDWNRQWFKAEVGLGAQETSRDMAFCAHAIHGSEVMEVPDASKDIRFADNPLVTSHPHIRFYAGAPLMSPDGFALGTLCAIDTKPKNLTDFQRRALQILSGQVVQLLELRRTLAEVNENAKKLHAANESKDRLFSIISHDLKTPFNGLLGLSDVLCQEWETLPREEMRDLAEDLHHSAEAGFRLVEQMLQWALLEKQGLANPPVVVDLKSLVSEVVATVEGVSGQKQILLSQETSGDLRVLADANMLRSVVQNLVSNALKFTPEKGRVTIRVHRSGDTVTGEIEDTGLGLSPQRVEQILTSHSTHSTLGTSGEKGTGLGLVLCRQMLERNQGRLTLRSEIGKGSTFTFTLPGLPSL